MGKNSEWFNFDDIGTKIKNFAKWSCWIEIILVWIAAIITFIVLIADDWTAYLCWIPLVSAIVLPFLIWISSWILYAFGELVENSNSTNNVVKKIENNTHNLKNNHQEKQEIKETKNSIKNQEKTKSSSVNVKLIANDLHSYTPNGSTPCDSATHKKYKDNLGNNIGAKTKDGHWEMDSILNERVFVCNHCHGIIAFETDFNNNQES